MNKTLMAAMITLLCVGCTDRQMGMYEPELQPSNPMDDVQTVKDTLFDDPRDVVRMWYQAWKNRDRDLLDRVMLEPLEEEVHLGDFFLLNVEFVRVDTLERDFDQDRNFGAQVGDVVVDAEAEFDSDGISKTKTYFILRRDSKGLWRILDYSAYEP